MVKVNSGPWLEKGAGLAKLRDDYNSMQRRFNIALKRIELMAAKVRLRSTLSAAMHTALNIRLPSRRSVWIGNRGFETGRSSIQKSW